VIRSLVRVLSVRSSKCITHGLATIALCEETSERLDVIPAQYRVIVTHRPRLAWRACERIVQAPAPEHLIKSGLPKPWSLPCYALFAGHDDGAENWAIVASLIEACKLNDIEPQAYLADVLVRLVNLWPNNPLERILREIRRRTRVVGAFPDGQSALNLAAARLRHIAGTAWSTKRYLNIELLKDQEMRDTITA
jgi:hypothetical protein